MIKFVRKRRELGKYLSFKRDYLNSVLSGRKRSTIRLGIVTPRNSRVYLECNGKIYGELYIESTEYVKFSELTEKDAVRDGFNSLEELKDALKNIYTNLSGEDWVTIIHFRLIEKYVKPVERSEIEKGVEGVSYTEVARLGLAYSTYSSSTERRVLTAVAYAGDIDTALEKLSEDISHRRVFGILKKTFKKLVKMGVLRSS